MTSNKQEEVEGWEEEGTRTYLLDDQLQHDLRRRAQIIDLDELGLVETILWC